MKNKNRRNKLAFTPILTIAASAVVAACFYASFNIIIRSIRLDLENGTVGGIESKLANLNYVAVIGFSAFVIIYACIQIINYFALSRLHQRHATDSEAISQARDIAIEQRNALHDRLKTGGKTAVLLDERSEEQTRVLGELYEGLNKIASTSKQLFVNSAAVDNAVAQLVRTIETLHNDIHDEALSPSGLFRTAEGDGYLTDGGVYEENGAYSETGAYSDADSYEELFTGADVYVDKLNRARAGLREKIDACATIIKNATMQANVLSLNAAVESAKAGEAGRGFVYVAEDIRTHADELRKANAEIRDAAEQSDSQIAWISELSEIHAAARQILFHIVGDDGGAGAMEDADGVADAADTTDAADKTGAANAADSGLDADFATEIAAVTLDATANAAEDKAAGTDAGATHTGATPAGATPAGATPTDATPTGATEIPVAWDREFHSIFDDLNAIRVAIRTVGAALAESSDAAASEIKRIDLLTAANSEISESAKELASLLVQVETQIDTIGDNSSESSLGTV